MQLFYKFIRLGKTGLALYNISVSPSVHPLLYFQHLLTVVLPIVPVNSENQFSISILALIIFGNTIKYLNKAPSDFYK